MSGFESLSGAHGRPVLRRGLRIERLGDQRLVLDPVSGVIHTIHGAAVAILDGILAGRRITDKDAEVLAALAGANIVSIPQVSRRDALEFAAGASLLISSLALPSAVAAASGAVASVSGSDGVLNSFALADGSTLYSLTHESLTDATVTRSLVIGAASRNVELVLVGGGGAGGSGAESTLIYCGGGGGGEVRYVDLGAIDPSTSFELIVAGRGNNASGQDTTVNNLTTTSLVASADGGGIGGGATAAAQGGSGGGGSSTQTAAGGSTAPGNPRFGAAGASGASGTTGGGGGAGATAASTGTSTNGGNGGSAKPLSDFFDLTVAEGADPVTGQLDLGGGGGGAGAGTSFDNRGNPGSGGGYGGVIFGGSAALGGEDGTAGSGGGGGGGITRVSGSTATGGVGATGAIWVRVS